MNSMRIHVLVDICGLHANGTTLYKTILAQRPAGVQVLYLALCPVLVSLCCFPTAVIHLPCLALRLHKQRKRTSPLP
jgi:hypothetical protein